MFVKDWLRVILVAISFLTFGCRAKEKVVVVQGETKKISTSGPCPILLPVSIKKGVDVECGTIISNVEKDNPSAGEIRVSYFRVFAKNKSQPKPPLFVHFGGPGDDGEGPFFWAVRKRDSLADERDIIIVGQRGTTHSFVLPECPTQEPTADTLDAVIVAETQSSELCKKLLDNAGITLPAFSTTAAVRDVEALRMGLGFEKISFYGVSYGTQFALEYVRQFPASVDKLLLDSIIAPNQDMAEAHVNEFSDIARYLVDLRGWCQSQATCTNAFGGTVPDFAQSLERLMAANQPVTVILGKPLSTLSLLTFGRSAGMSRERRLIYAALVNAGAAPASTWTAEGLNSKFADTLAVWRALGFQLPTDEKIAEEGRGVGFATAGFSTGVNVFLNCAESGFAASRVTELITGSQYTYIGGGLRQKIIDAAKIRDAGCSAFRLDNEKWRQTFAQPVQSGVKSYLFNSTFDSATPLKNAQLAKQTLSDSLLFEFRCSAHSVLINTPEQCGTSIIKTALAGTLTQDNVGCVCAN